MSIEKKKKKVGIDDKESNSKIFSAKKIYVVGPFFFISFYLKKL